jgi:hypothetical protein
VATDNKKRIDAKQFVSDVEAGMHPTALMATYGLSPSELQKAFKKLEERGLLKPPKKAEPPPVSRTQRTFECPSCGAAHAEPFDECPSCGVVVSKIRERVPAAGRSPREEESRGAASREHRTVPTVAKTGIVKIVGIAVIVVVLVAAFLVYRGIKRSELLSLTTNVQAVLDASNAPTVPNYSRLAQIFGDATGAMAVVLESRRTPYNEKMHELYQKLVYLGDLQRSMQWKGSGSVKNTGAYRHAMDVAGSNQKLVGRELDSLAHTLDAERSALAGASEEGERSGRAPQHVTPGSPSGSGPETGNDSTAAQFEKAQDEMRSLCAQVLQILATL